MCASMSGNTNQQLLTQRHAKYYIDDGNIIFLVESTLFQIHRYFFIRDSVVFRDMLSMPPSSGAMPVEGSSDEQPIVLPGVKSLDFERLLWFYYESMNFKSADTSPKDLVAIWSSILSLADMWQFEGIRTLAIETLGTLSFEHDPLDKIAIAQKYDITLQWAKDEILRVCSPRWCLTVLEARRIGVDLTTLIGGVRQLFQIACTYSRSPHGETVDLQALLAALVDQIIFQGQDLQESYFAYIKRFGPLSVSV